MTTYNQGDVRTVPPMESNHDRIHELELAVTAERVRADRAENALQYFKDRVVEVGNNYAETNDWCSTYDEIMEELGLPGRTRSFDVYVRVTASYLVTVDATNYEGAQDTVREQSVSGMWRAAQPFANMSTSPAHDVNFETSDEDGDF